MASANALDARITRDATKISADYEAIVTLSVRQALAACELTAGKDSTGNLNPNDVLYFLKGMPVTPILASPEVISSNYRDIL